MPVLLLPALLLVMVLVWALLLPVALWQRYRRGRARRRATPWLVRANAWALLASTAVFVAGAWVAGFWVEGALSHAAVGLAAGVALGIVGLWLTRFDREATDGFVRTGWALPPGVAVPAGLRLYYTANRWLVLGLTLLVAGRVSLGLWQLGRLLRVDGSEHAWLAQQGGLLAVAGVLLGHYLAYTWGLRRRLPR